MGQILTFESEWHAQAALSDICSAYQALRPPRRISVSQGATRSLKIHQPGQPPTDFDPALTPYMVEPMDMLASRDHESVCFVGPARTGKTNGLVVGFMTHAAVNDPGDMLIISMTEDKARELSKTDIRRALTNSPDLVALKSAVATDTNVHDIMFKHGMWLKIAWPTASNVSGSTYRYVVITDLDRIKNAENVDNEGPLFKLALKRTTTFMSRGMTAVESSPGKELQDPNWTPATPHEAPPVGGILGIYNQSDRRRWMWQCFDCYEWFEASPGLDLFHLPPEDELLEGVRTLDIGAFAKQYSRIACPHCASRIEFKWRRDLNAKAKWLQEGQRLTKEGDREGEAVRSTIAGYWLGGVAATYQSWESLISRYLQGLRDYALTGSEETLKTTVNTDQGAPYLPRVLAEAKARSRDPAERTESTLKRYMVPDEARCLIASVDVQGGRRARFVVQVHAIGPYREQWLVDRYEITKSRRKGDMHGDDFAPIDPASHPEDWLILTDRLVKATYRTGMEGKELGIRKTVVDTGGEDGVTESAYQWYRSLRHERLHGRVMLYKGSSYPDAPVVKMTLVGSGNGAKDAADIPLYVCNPHKLSDIVDAGLKRRTPGPGYIHFPQAKGANNPHGWLAPSFFDELKAEVRNEKGLWAKVRERNETFDLCRMIAGAIIVLEIDKIEDWARTPPWLAPLASNSMLITADERREIHGNVSLDDTLRMPVARPSTPAARARRISRSSYLGA